MERTLQFSEVLKQGITEITVYSYGYTERNVFGKHFEPFARRRAFIFKIKDGHFVHSWLHFEHPRSEIYWTTNDGIVYCDDPDLWAKADD